MKLVVSAAPHIRDKISTKTMMRDVVIALLPATIVGVYLFGLKALISVITSMIAAVLTEIIILKIRRKKITSEDLSSALVTGLLLALCLSSALPWWMVALGAFFAIAIAKQTFGGLGYNIFNPALAGRAFLTASWPVLMTTWLQPFSAVTTATPLALAKSNLLVPDYWNLFLGIRAGSIGETSILALLIGVIYLFFRKTIDWQIPLTFIGTVVLGTIIFGRDPVFHLLSGGLILGAFYMATDPVTAPVTQRGRWIFGFGCGLITVIIRLLGGYPEGVCYAILIMNAATPLLERLTLPRRFGKK